MRRSNINSLNHSKFDKKSKNIVEYEGKKEEK